MIRKDIYKRFTLSSFPILNCPVCQVGTIILDKKSINTYETRASKEAHGHEAWEPDWITETFHGTLTCTNPKCKDKVIVVGDVEVDLDVECDKHGLVREPYINYYTIKYSYPPLNLFTITDAVPEDIKNIINLSFGMYFYSPSSAANQARIALEKVITSLKVRVYQSRTGKRKRLSLHDRINLLPEKYSSEKKLFMAIKWLGNVGSHDNNISHSDLLDIYEIFEKLLREVYGQDEKRISRLAKEVIKRKGPKKKR
jgi:hypothetical protein